MYKKVKNIHKEEEKIPIEREGEKCVIES